MTPALAPWAERALVRRVRGGWGSESGAGFAMLAIARHRLRLLQFVGAACLQCTERNTNKTRCEPRGWAQQLARRDFRGLGLQATSRQVVHGETCRVETRATGRWQSPSQKHAINMMILIHPNFDSQCSSFLLTKPPSRVPFPPPVSVVSMTAGTRTGPSGQRTSRPLTRRTAPSGLPTVNSAGVELQSSSL